MNGYKQAQRTAWILLLVAFALGGLGALSCRTCDTTAQAAPQAATVTISRTEYLALANKLITLEEERNLARSEVKKLSGLLGVEQTKREHLIAIERNACASKLANERILQAKQKQACAKCPDCTGWKVGTGIGAGAVLVCAAVCVGREATRRCP